MFSLVSPFPLPSLTPSPKLLSAFSLLGSHPTPLFPGEACFRLYRPSSFPSVSASPPTLLSAVVLLSPSPPRWASRGDAEGLSLPLSSLSACLHLTGSVAVEASCLYISLSLPSCLSPPRTALHCLLSSLFLPPTPSHCSNSLSLFPSSLLICVSSPCCSHLRTSDRPRLYNSRLFPSSLRVTIFLPLPHLQFARESSRSSIKTPVLLIPL